MCYSTPVNFLKMDYCTVYSVHNTYLVYEMYCTTLFVLVIFLKMSYIILAYFLYCFTAYIQYMIN